MTHSLSFNSFAEFYDFYLQQHLNPVCKRLHVLGVITSLSLTVALLATGQWSLLGLVPIVGYSCSWTGHFVFEKNKPATFGYPLYSFWGDFRMTLDYLRQALISKGKTI
jgi:hypothetical protein